MDISNIKNLTLGWRLVFRKPGQTGSLEFESTIVVEGLTTEYNFIYGRILHGKTIGTLLPDSVPGRGVVVIRIADLDGYEIECKPRYGDKPC